MSQIYTVPLFEPQKIHRPSGETAIEEIASYEEVENHIRGSISKNVKKTNIMTKKFRKLSPRVTKIPIL
jgi:hypothetical protein